MTESKSGSGDEHKLLNQSISAFVSVTHIIAFFQIVICSRHLAVAFNIPPKNIGIYFPKLYSLRSVLMSMACGIEYGIYRIIQISTGSGSKNGGGSNSNTALNTRRYLSIVWFVLLTVCEISFLCVLYFSKSVAFHNYIVLNIEGMFFGFFQMSILSLIPEFASYYMLSLYVSGTCIFIIQTIIDRCTKNSMLSVKIQAWICVVCSVICVPLWIYYLIKLFKDPSQTTTQTCNSGGSTSSQTHQQPATTSGSGGEVAEGGGSGAPGPAPLSPSSPQMEYVMSLTSISILKIMTCKLEETVSGLSHQSVINVQMLISRLHQIRYERQITYDVLVAIDLVILSLKKCGCSDGKLCLLAELSLFLRIKTMIKPSKEELEQQQTAIQELSYAYGGLGVQNGKQCSRDGPVVIAAARYIQTVKSVQSQELTRSKRSLAEPTLSPTVARTRTRRSVQQQPQSNSNGKTSIYYSISPFLMFGAGSLVKDFLFPGVIPFGLLERDKCHLINLIVIIFLSVGPVVIFVLNRTLSEFKSDHKWIHLFWFCMIPEIVIFLISLNAIHSKQGCTHQIRSSRWRVFLMTMILLTCYGFLETVNIVGVPNIAGKTLPDLIPINNIFGKFVRYFVYKLSVGYNKTRISAGFTLPNFKPPEPIGDTFWFWFKGSFSNGWKDIKSDFKFNIKQYLAASDQVVPKNVPILTSVYPDLLR